MGSWLDQAAARIAARTGTGRLASHLEDRYGIGVTGTAELDLGVYRVDRRDGPSWIARLFPAARPAEAAAGDGRILRFLAEHDFPAERCAAPDPLSVLDGQALLVTEYLTPVPREQRRAAIRDLGGLRHLGEMLGRLHTLPPTADAGTNTRSGDGVGGGARPGDGVGGGAVAAAIARDGGGWHHLVDGGPSDEVAAARGLLADAASLVPASGQARYASIRRELDALDDCAGLPRALLHPDFVLRNVIASPDRGLVPVDWTGAGRGPRLWPLAWLLFTEGARGLGRVDLVAAGYLRRVRPEPEELSRLPAAVPARMMILDAWSFCLGRKSLEEAARGVGEARQLADAVAARAQTAFSNT